MIKQWALVILLDLLKCFVKILYYTDYQVT
jgi:hypothetical protein